VLVTHDPERVLAGADRAIVLGPGGHVVRDCAAADLNPGEARSAIVGAAT